MKTTVTLREYDDEGRVTRETVTEYDSADYELKCSCGSYTWCQMHGWRYPTTQPSWPTIYPIITCSETTTLPATQTVSIN